MNRFEQIDITVDKAPNLIQATDRAGEIAGQFFNGDDNFELEQVSAYPEQEIITNGAGTVVAKTPVTFVVSFIARRAL